MKYITVKSLKEKLKLKSRQDLVDEIIDLFKAHKVIKAHYSIIDDASMAIALDDAKKQIYAEFLRFETFTPPKARIAYAKKILAEFKKQPVKPNYVVDLHLYYIYALISFVGTYGAYESHFDAVISAFGMLSKVLKTYQLEENYKSSVITMILNAPPSVRDEVLAQFPEYSKE